MRRRDVPKALLASAAGTVALTLPSPGSAQTCTAPCFPRTQGEIDASVTPVDYSYPPGNIRRYGAGTGPDDAPAVRKALDVAARDGTTVTCIPAGLIKINSTVYIPQRFNNEGEKGFLMDFYGSTFRGTGRGSGVIFETGTGILSTGGSTNFGQTNESAASMHAGTIIAGARFRECGTAINLFNFLKGCKLQDLYFEDVDHCVTTLRSFYLELHNCHAQIVSVTPGHVLFDFNGVNNAMTVVGCEAGGGAGNTGGIGFRFTGIGSGIIFHGNTAETLDKGLVINSAISGIDIRQCYFESLATAGIYATGGGAKIMDVEGNWFLQCGTGITPRGWALIATGWVSGTFGASNNLAGGDYVEIVDADSRCTVEISPEIFSEGQASASAVGVPANYRLGSAVIRNAPRMVYVASVGLSSVIAVDAGASFSTPAFYYSGGNAANGQGFNVPFVTQTLNNGSSLLDTQITWSDVRMIVVFDLYLEIGSARRLRGLVFAGGAVQRFDGDGLTVTASSNSGKLRLTIGGAAHSGVVASGFLGQVRHM